MRAIVFAGPGQLSLQELPDPEPVPGELLLDVAACGVCRTDLQIVSGDIAPRKLPVVPGHQVVARTADGARVGVAWLGGADGTCEHCLAGRENLCERAEFTGWTRDGGYAERMVAR
ncbi:MAG TPA: alcohol dehydrogenase catalytic domain-containing protein, partial [Gaiellales bacterium]|nr:alcohol dehydrogenase catalytic domain-containing protein [Gaiellales bacterium]